MVFNVAMTDAELIKHYGGPSRIAAMLGWHESRAVQRIHNWRSRGIPARVKLQFPHIFLAPELAAPAQALRGNAYLVEAAGRDAE